MTSNADPALEQKPSIAHLSKSSSSPPPSELKLPAPSPRDEEVALLRKVDLHLLPMLFLLFLLAFVDRVNIGNARIQGLEAELGLSGNQYNVALFVFFIPYILFEVPSNVIIKRVKPSTWLGGIMVFWGVATVGMGLVRDFAGLVACRVLLGLFEAGLFPGCIYLISMYYRRYELQRRITLFFCASIIAGAFGGLLAFAIARMDGVGGYSGWRWIFILEGMATVLVGILAKFLVADWPEEVKFLNDQERRLLLERLRDDAGIAQMNRLDGKAIKRVAKDWKIYCGTLMYFGVVETGYAGSFFLPTILLELGYTSAVAQVRTIPIYVVATAGTLATAILTDKLRHRFTFTLVGVVLGAVGYLILLCGQSLSPGAKYAACFFVVTGGYITQPITITWLANNMGGHFKKSIGSAVQIGFGNSGGIIASNVFMTNEAPGYQSGYGTSLAMLLLCGVSCVVFWWGLKRENGKREAGERDYRLGFEREEVENLGDDHPEFRFAL